MNISRHDEYFEVFNVLILCPHTLENGSIQNEQENKLLRLHTFLLLDPTKCINRIGITYLKQADRQISGSRANR